MSRRCGLALAARQWVGRHTLLEGKRRRKKEPFRTLQASARWPAIGLFIGWPVLFRLRVVVQSALLPGPWGATYHGWYKERGFGES